MKVWEWHLSKLEQNWLEQQFLRDWVSLRALFHISAINKIFPQIFGLKQIDPIPRI